MFYFINAGSNVEMPGINTIAMVPAIIEAISTDDISVVGFDDIPQVKYLDPPLTTLRHSLADTAGIIFEQLMEQIKTQTCAHKSQTYFKGRLIERESVKNLIS